MSVAMRRDRLVAAAIRAWLVLIAGLLLVA